MTPAVPEIVWRMQRMTLDVTKIQQRKRAFRERLATRPIEEKLAMLDALRERAITLIESRSRKEASGLREEPPPYQAQSKQGK
jgi:3-mercaptopyruvate sulfurtransferase SseA